MPGIVLLARPHPLLVKHMKPFPCGAVMAVGAASTLETPLPEVFTRIRRAAPAMPVMFASLFDAQHAARAVRSLSVAPGLEVPVKNIDDYDAAVPSYVQVSVFDLDNPLRRYRTSDIVRRHLVRQDACKDRNVRPVVP